VMIALAFLQHLRLASMPEWEKMTTVDGPRLNRRCLPFDGPFSRKSS
jgi:hypothetical protein